MARRRSLRFRITAAATGIVLAAVAVGAVLFVLLLRQSLESGVRDAARTDADSIVAQIAAGGPGAIAAERDVDGRFFQVVDVAGRVVASSVGARGEPRAFAPVDEATVRVDNAPFAVVAVAADHTVDTADPSPAPVATPDDDDGTSDDDDPSDDGPGTSDDSDRSDDDGRAGDGESSTGSSTDSEDDGNPGRGRGSGNGGSGPSGSNSSGHGGSADDGPGKGRSGNGGSSNGGSSNGGSGNGGSGGADPSDDPEDSGMPAIGAATIDAEPAASVSTAYLVVTGRTLAGIDDTVATTARLLALTVPLLVALLALATWLTVGRALRPVDRMRAELDDVSSAHLDRRIAHPGTADEIGRLATTMNAMLDRLDDAQRAQRRFVSDASHELKSPLASLRQYAEVARSHPDRIGADELTDAVLDEGARLERLVQGMLVLARADESGLVGGDDIVDLDDLLLSEAIRVRSAGSRRVDTSGITAVRVRGDAGMLGQVVRNLVDNAVRHATETVRLSVVETAEGAELTVDDDGEGIAVEERERVFDRFVRLDQARSRDGGGSGLGLAIVRELVAAHESTIAVTDAPGGGARFVVRFPAHRLAS